MKKIILMSFAACLLTLAGNAQYVGVKGGLNLSNLNIDQVDDENMRIGYHVGAYLNLPVTEAFAIQPEVLYATKGAKMEYHQDLGILGSIDGNAQLHLDYIDIPILAVFKLGENFELNLGPYFGFLARSKYQFEGSFEASGDIDNDNFTSLDYGLVGGFAINVAALQIGARYNYGLQKIQDSDAAEMLFKDAQNSYFQVFAAIRFGSYN